MLRKSRSRQNKKKKSFLLKKYVQNKFSENQRQNSSLNSEKDYFWPISPIFQTKSFSKKSDSVMHNLIRVSTTMPKFRET